MGAVERKRATTQIGINKSSDTNGFGTMLFKDDKRDLKSEKLLPPKLIEEEYDDSASESMSSSISDSEENDE